MGGMPNSVWLCDSGIWFDDDQGEPEEYKQYVAAETFHTILSLLDSNASRDNIRRVIEAAMAEGEGGLND